jgi:hypothetical protein
VLNPGPVTALVGPVSASDDLLHEQSQCGGQPLNILTHGLACALQYYVTGNLTRDIYAPDCRFKDPTTDVKGGCWQNIIMRSDLQGYCRALVTGAYIAEPDKDSASTSLTASRALSIGVRPGSNIAEHC